MVSSGLVTVSHAGLQHVFFSKRESGSVGIEDQKKEFYVLAITLVKLCVNGTANERTPVRKGYTRSELVGNFRFPSSYLPL